MLTRPITIVELLTVMFIGLKITDQIDWSWWWVLSPSWVALIVHILFLTYTRYKNFKNEGRW